MDKREYFWQVLDDLMWDDSLSTISAKLIHTAPIKEVYIVSGNIRLHPSTSELHRFFRDAGYTYLGQCFVKGGSYGKGSFWTKYPDLFLTGGVVDRKAVKRCVYRRSLYLKVKPLLDKKTLYSVGEVAKLFGKSINTIRDWSRTGILPTERTIGGHRRYDLSRLLMYP